MSLPALLKIVIKALTILIEIIYIPINFLRLFQKFQKCPPITDKTLLLTATEVAQKIRKKQITSLSVVQAYIKRIKEVNPIINAVIEDRFEEALEDAQKADDIVQNSGLDELQLKNKYPLLGVPITIKGSIGVVGMNHGAGRPDRLEKAERDAVATGYVKSAGAIPLLISNVPELCLNWETVNKLVGVTKNPYDTRRTPGGSSGGEASLLACGASLIGLGSDIAGSLRLPAHCCGVWGHKPSPHVVSSVGHYPDCKNKDEWDRVFTIGPMARYASDLKLLLDVIAEPEIRKELDLHKAVDLGQIKVYYMDDLMSSLAREFSDVVVAALEKVVAHLDVVSHQKCKKIKIPLMKYCVEMSYLRLLGVGEVDTVFDNKTHGGLTELFKYYTGRSDHQFTSICFELISNNVGLLSSSMKKVQKGLHILREEFMKLLGENGVFLLPTIQFEAHYHGEMLNMMFDSGGLSIFNSLGFPATNCPVMFSPNGLPIGIQVVAAPNMDRLTLAVAEEIERAFGGWKFS